MAGRSAAAEKEDVPAVAQAEPQSIFDTIAIETKAGTFEFREIDGETYDKCVELSTKGEPDAERVDMVMLLRWLAAKSAVGANALTLEGLNKLSYKIRNRVLSEVNSLYFPDDMSDMANQLARAGWTVTPPKKDDSPNS